MRKTMKPGRKYFIINIDEPYAEEVFEVLKALIKAATDDLADYLIEYATPAFEHQDRELLEKVLLDYFKGVK